MLIWKSILDEVIGDYTLKIADWEKKHRDFPIVLPVQHFDMMYNVIKHLADVSYYDIPEEADIDEVYDYFVRLYKNIEEELSKQDAVYFGSGQKVSGFAECYRSSLFYQEFIAKEGEDNYNPYVKEILVSMMKAVIPAQHSRDGIGIINSPTHPVRIYD